MVHLKITVETLFQRLMKYTKQDSKYFGLDRNSDPHFNLDKPM